MKKQFNKTIFLLATIFPFIGKANIQHNQDFENRRVMEILNELFSTDNTNVYKVALMSKPQLESLLAEPLSDYQYKKLIRLIWVFIETGINFEIKDSSEVILATQDFKADL